MDLNYFKFSCKNSTCWTGYNNYYSEDNEWFWLSYGQVNEDADLIFNNISGINASLSENENGCVVYDSTIEMFSIVDCDDESLDYQFICDSNQSFDQVGNASSRYVTLPMKMNWFDAQSFCMENFCLCLFFFFLILFATHSLVFAVLRRVHSLFGFYLVLFFFPFRFSFFFFIYGTFD